MTFVGQRMVLSAQSAERMLASASVWEDFSPWSVYEDGERVTLWTLLL